MASGAAASTSRGEARAQPEVITKKPRPKPIPRKPPPRPTDAAPFAPPSDFSSTITPAPRNVPASALLQPILPADPRPQDVPLTIADRAKSRARTAKSKPVAQDTDIIEIPSDDEDERLLRLSPLRPKKMDVPRAKTRPIPDLPPPSIHPSQESLVIPTSDFQLVPAVSSQLPPSDPPSSTLPLPASTPESAKKRRQGADAGRAEESPLKPSKKRKRRNVATDDGDNQLHVPPPQVIATDDQPPNFFASSSSSLPPPPAPLVQAGSRKEKPVRRNRFSDEVPPPEAIVPDLPREKKSRPKPKKKSVLQFEPNEATKPPLISESNSRPRPDTGHRTYKSAEVVDDSDEEAGTLVLPPPPLQLDSQSPLSDLSETTNLQPPKPITPSRSRKRLVPEVVITTVPTKRTSSPRVQEAGEGGSADKDMANGSPKGKKRQKKAVEEDYFDGLNDELEAVPKNRSKAKAPPRGKGRTKPPPKETVDDQEFEEGHADDTTGTSKKAKSKAKTKATTKAKPIKSGKSRVVDSEDEAIENPGVVPMPMEDEETAVSSMAQRTAKQDEIAPPRDAEEGQENTPPPPNRKPNPNATPSLVSRRTPAPISASSFTRLNYGHSIANEERSMSMTEIIKKANSASGTPSGIKSYSSFMKGSRTVLRKIAPLHARRKTPPPLPPKPPPPKKTKKQLDLEEKWEEELEETIEGWAALSSQERELLRKQKRDMEMGYED